ncbi:MAG: hypothetical protein M0D55_11260 [Elusimicrobiota bacterium]|nr:MAG: hypothetical protein M0D55_11260 [Elusimicrobiota bacterium]
MMDALMGFDPRRAARFVGLGALFLFLCWQHVQATRIGYRVETRRREARALRSRVADLRLRVDETMAPAALAARASDKLGMIPASPSSLRSLSGAEPAAGLLTRLWARLPPALPARS